MTRHGRNDERQSSQWQKLRKAWAATIATQPVTCHHCHHPINPTQPWDLDHLTPLALGGNLTHARPAHRSCNRAASHAIAQTRRRRAGQAGKRHPLQPDPPPSSARTPSPATPATTSASSTSRRAGHGSSASTQPQPEPAPAIAKPQVSAPPAIFLADKTGHPSPLGGSLSPRTDSTKPLLRSASRRW